MADQAPDRDKDRCALGIVELSSIARGVVVADAAVKQAPSLLLMSRPMSSGKHLVMMRGEVAEVEESMKVAREVAEGALLDWLELPYLHEPIWAFLDQPAHQPYGAHGWSSGSGEAGNASWAGDEAAESVAIIETTTVCATVGGADKAGKTAPVTIRDMRLAVGIGGKAFFTFTGELADVQAAAEAASDFADTRLFGAEVIPAPADEIRGRLIF